MSTKKASLLTFTSIIIAFVAIVSLFSAIYTANFRVPSESPTATYSGYLSSSYIGTYHYLDEQPTCAQSFPPCLVPSEVIFYLTTQNGTLIHLYFYCGADYCRDAQQLPLTDGAKIHVEGTLLVPSSWPTSEYNPPLRFTADLFVFSYAAA
jgi:hypothetical protein